jgi:diaminopimelate decarboxylase
MTLFELRPSSRQGLNLPTTRPTDQPTDCGVWPLSSYRDERGQLHLGGVPAAEIAAEFGTPTHVVDEQDFRAQIRRYRASLPDAEIVYSGMALLSTAVAGWAAAEGAGVAVRSAGELATVLAGGVPASRIILHGNAKTAAELHDAAAAGVGRVVIDSPNEITLLAARVRRLQRVLVRVIPDLQTNQASGQEFGFSIAGGQAAGAVKRVLNQACLDLVGLHCQLGSQIADAGLYGEAIRQMIAVMAQVRDRHRVVLTELNIGGGQAVSYRPGDPELNPHDLAATIETALTSACAEHGYPRPQIVLEPGRAIAARAGVTLCRVVAVKRQPGGHTFVAVDGAMTNIPANAPGVTKYLVALVNRQRFSVAAPATVVGRHCETGDAIARDVNLPTDIRPGDLLAVACTGAYQHSMGSRGNLDGQPPLIAVLEGRARELVRRETVADQLARDCGWPGLSHQRRSATAS